MIKNNLFGTDGIRRAVGTAPLTQDALPILGRAIAQWAVQKYGQNSKILFAQDTRVSCSWVKTMLKSGLLLYPVELFDAYTLPTPAAYLLVQKSTYDCAIVISASHNAYQDNGIKIIDAQDGKLSSIDEQIITQLFYAYTAQEPSYSSFGTDVCADQANDFYEDYITSQFKANFLQGKTIVLDCANGATYQVAPAIFKKLGAKIILINAAPNGTNINHDCGALHPQLLQQAVLENKADAGFAFDGDGDRLTLVTPDGTIKDGDAILALLRQHPNYTTDATVVGTIMSNQGLEHYLNSTHAQLIRTQVGDKYVAQALIQYNAKLGGEPSGHIIMRDYLNTGDGIFAALRVLEAIEHTNNSTMNTYTPFPHVLINVHVADKKDLTSEPLASLISAAKCKLPQGRLIVRYSGTENVLRIFVEDENNFTAQQIGYSLAAALQKELL